MVFKIYLHAKFHASSLKIVRIMLNLVIGSHFAFWQPFENWLSYAEFSFWRPPLPHPPVTLSIIELYSSRQLTKDLHIGTSIQNNTNFS